MSSSADVTALLARARRGDDAARDELVKATYDELRGRARAHLERDRPGHTLQATALVNEVYSRMLAGQGLPGENRAQFLGFVARAMRQLLVNHARDRGRLKRGGGAKRVPLDENLLVGGDRSFNLVAFDDALERLAQVAPRQAQVVELRYFGGLSVEEAAEALAISPRTVKRDWEAAGTLLLNDLGGKSANDG